MLVVETESLDIFFASVRIILLILPVAIHAVSIHVIIIIVSIAASLIIILIALTSHVMTPISTHRFIHGIIEGIWIFLVEISSVVYL